MGQIAQAASNPNTFQPDPSGFNKSEWATRIGGMGLKGLGQGLQNYQQQNSAMRGGGGGMMPMPSGQPMVDPRYFLPQQSTGPNNLAFYGGGS